MFDRQFRESLRQLDIRCAQRARWLGVREKEKEVRDAEEIRRRAQEEARRIRRERDGFNCW